MHKVLFYFTLQIITTFVQGQNQSNNWYFGNKAALNFSTSPPVSLSNSGMLGGEGTSTISDDSGNLLFYTDGMSVWNKTHALMANGTGLAGYGTSTQASLIVKKPGSSHLYYVFTSQRFDIGGDLCYSEIDMSLAAGLGSVTVKNTTLVTQMTEKLTGALHCNGSDYWVVAHKYESNEFYSYLVTTAGVNTVPVTSAIGTPHASSTHSQNASYSGYMKIAPGGQKIGLVIGRFLNLAEIFDFNPSTGMVSNSLTLGSLINAYGCEFSPDGSKFYVTGTDSTGNNAVIRQWDLCAGAGTAIVASGTIVTIQNNKYFAAMQLSKDNKIYIANFVNSTLPVINDPNNPGTACNFQMTGPSLGTGGCGPGLSNFIGSYFREKPATAHSVSCATASFNYTLPSACNAPAYTVTGQQWNFGDAASGPANTSTLTQPTHVYSSAGTYTTSLILNYTCYNDTIRQIVMINIPTISITGNFSTCINQAATFTALGADSFSWSTGQQGHTAVITPSAGTVYTVSGTDTNTSCTSTKTFSIHLSACVGIAEISDGNTLFPNPVRDKITVKVNSPARVWLYDQLGKKLIDKQLEPGVQVIDLRILPPALYFLQVIEGNNHKFIKIVKE